MQDRRQPKNDIKYTN